MKLRLLAVVVLLALMAYVGQWLSKEPGYVMVVFAGYAVETTIWFWLAAQLVFLFSIYWLLKLFTRLQPVLRFKSWRQASNIRRSQKWFREGLLSWYQGENDKAHELFIKSSEHHQVVGNIMSLASSKPEKFKQLSQELTKGDARFSSLSDWLQSKLEYEQGLVSKAANRLKQMDQYDSPYALALKLTILSQQKDAKQLMEVLNKKSVKALIGHELVTKELPKAWQVIFGDASYEAHQFWSSLPKELKKRSAPFYFRQSQDEKVLLHWLNKQPSYELFEVYCELANCQAHLQWLEKCLHQHKQGSKQLDDQTLLLINLHCARLCLLLKHWGQAGDYLKDAAAIKTNRLYYVLASELHEQLGDMPMSLQFARKAIET